ncbi:glycosyltransferase [Prosthecochloris sp.]|uniref:glycosyltransferase n=1 Tax=Prosthecochloris sp. TaxID=290513 RepID=UPI00257BEDE1|nr:glycosyltransferase [Prosthecochloris sp.]
MISDESFQMTIAICTHNRSDLLFENVKKTLDVCQLCNWISLLIVDNASTDDTSNTILKLIDYGKLKGIKIESAFENKLGIAAARNCALDACETEFIAFIDDDAYIANSWVSAVKNAFQENDMLAACGGPVKPVYSIARPEWLSDRLLWAYSVHERGKCDRDYIFPDHPLGVNMVFNKKKLSLRFDELLGRKGKNLISWEESQFFRELMLCGGRVTYLSKAIVYHVIPQERLTKEWLKKRHKAEGVTKAIIALKKDSSHFYRFYKVSGAIALYVVFFALSFMPFGKEIHFFSKMKMLYFFGFLKGFLSDGQS